MHRSSLSIYVLYREGGSAIRDIGGASINRRLERSNRVGIISMPAATTWYSKNHRSKGESIGKIPMLIVTLEGVSSLPEVHSNHRW